MEDGKGEERMGDEEGKKRVKVEVVEEMMEDEVRRKGWKTKWLGCGKRRME